MYSRAQELSGGGSSSLVSTDSSASSSMRRLESSVSPLNKQFTPKQQQQQPIYSTNQMIRVGGGDINNIPGAAGEMMMITPSPEDLYNMSFDSSQQQQRIVTSPVKKIVGAHSMIEEMPASRRDHKWVRQMTKRIKGFVTNTPPTFGDFDQASNQGSDVMTSGGPSSLYERRNFTLPLEKCEPSSISLVSFKLINKSFI